MENMGILDNLATFMIAYLYKMLCNQKNIWEGTA
jgi:hypothetical protein